MEATYTVSTRDMRDALKAVLPHHDRTKTGGDGESTLHRVRLSFGTNELIVMATNLTTTGIAVVPLLTEDGAAPTDILDLADDDGNTPPASLIVDILPARARRLVGNFPVAAHDPEGTMQLLRWEIFDSGAEVLDVSGLFAGDSYTLKFAGKGGNFPDVWGMAAEAFAAAQQTPHVKPLTAAGRHLAAFRPASEVYETPLTVEPTGTAEARGFVVRCGSRFFGMISSGHNDDDSLHKRDRDRQTWAHRFDGRTLRVAG